MSYNRCFGPCVDVQVTYLLLGGTRLVKTLELLFVSCCASYPSYTVDGMVQGSVS